MPDQEQISTPNASCTTLFMGIFATFMGVLIILFSVDVIHADPESIHAPRWVLTLAGMMFTFIGLYIISTGIFSASEQNNSIVKWIQYFLILGMMTAFSAVFLWVGFGTGEREFSGSGSFLFFTVSGKGNNMMGRIMFGGGGILLALMTGYYALTGALNIINNTTDLDSPQE